MQSCHKAASKIVGDVKLTWLNTKLILPSVERYYCPVCDEEFYDARQATEFDRLRKQAFQKHNSLTGTDVQRIRKKLKLSQSELEQKLGLGSKVIVRWENGKVRLPGPVNALLKILDKQPKALTLV